jgi:2-polyprenyl-3-methyl-5-hydroxy-6-metoxy-1,4-benzoquinol methylase
MNHREIVMKELVKFVKDKNISGKVIDVGAGNDCLKFEFEGLGFEWTGFDKISISQQYSGYMEDMHQIKDDSYDLVFCCHAFEHCENPIQALKEFKRIVKPTGFIFVATPSPCEHQILKGDADHIFVLNDLQMKRLLKFVELKGDSFIQTENIKEVQNYNVITTAWRKK